MSPIRSISLRARLCASSVVFLGLVAACGGGSLPPSGTSSLAERTFAGQNKCNPKNADRPFIIEWDATDQSSFQSYAANDIVFVRYQGCELKALDGCREGSAKGSFGSYKPVEFTSGGVETVDIHDEGELYSKLRYGRTDDIIRFGLHEYLMDFVKRISSLGNEISRHFLVPA